MDAVLNVGLPIFALTFVGYLAAWRKLLGAASTEALNRFVYYFALPALLFVTMFRVPIGVILNGPYLAAYLGGLIATLLAGLVANRLYFRCGTADFAVQIFTAVYANVGYMGIPLCLMAWGQEGLPPAIVATIVTASLLFACAVIAIESELRAGSGLHASAAGVLRVLLRNPLLIAPLLGMAWSASGVPLPSAIRLFCELLGGAAGPCALFALGLFLAGQSLREDLKPVGWLVFLKLLVMPLVTWLLAFHVFPVEPIWAKAAVLLNALPAGAGAFVLAQQYNIRVARVSSVILISTALSVATISYLLAVLAG